MSNEYLREEIRLTLDNMYEEFCKDFYKWYFNTK